MTLLITLEALAPCKNREEASTLFEDKKTYYVKKPQHIVKTTGRTIQKSCSATTLNIPTSAAVYRIEKRIFIFERYKRNSSQSDFDLFLDYTYAKVVIVPAINLNIFGRQSDVVVQPARGSPEQPFCCGNVSFSHFFLPNYKGFGFFNWRASIKQLDCYAKW